MTNTLRKCCDTPRGNTEHAATCSHHPANVAKSQANDAKRRSENLPRELTKAESEPDWSRQCEVCGESPVVPVTGMCGPCTFGEADTIGGNW